MIADESWTAVDDYIATQLLGKGDELDAVLAASEQAGLPPGAIPANVGRFLELLVRMHGGRRVLEIGTLGGYSAMWLARGLPADGSLMTLEANARYAEVARANIAAAGLSGVVDVRVGPALGTLQTLVAESARPFDVIFIDADKQNNPGYLEWSLKLSGPGTVIIADNVVRGGRILDPDGQEPRLGDGGIQGLRRFYKLLAAEPRVSATVIQTVGVKGHDGFALALVTDEP